MALEIKFRPRKGPDAGTGRSRDVAVFIALDGRQMQSAGTIIMSEEEIEALKWTSTFSVTPGENGGDMLLSNAEDD